MRIKLTGTSFRSNSFELPVGAELDLIPDGMGCATKQEHSDPHALSVWWAGFFLGYIPKALNQDTFKKVAVSNVWYKSPKKSVQGVTTTYTEGDIIAGIEVECEGDFQITTDEGRTYETDGNTYESITSFLGRAMPSNLNPLMQWAFKNYKTYNEYKEGLSKYAEDGTDLHNKIEKYLISLQYDDEKYRDEGLLDLPYNVQRFFKSLDSFDVVSIEERCHDAKLGLAGTCDAVLEVKGKKIAFDWKSSKAVQLKHKVQSSFYAKNMGCDFAAVVCFGANNKQGYSVSKVNSENGYKYLTLLVEADKMSKQLTL